MCTCAALCADCSLALGGEGGEVELVCGKHFSIAWRGVLFLTEGEREVSRLSVSFLFFDAGGSVCECKWSIRTHTHTLHMW